MANPLTKLQSDAIKALYSAGFRDKAVASALHVGVKLVTHWREARDLAQPLPRRDRKIDHAVAMEMYDKGANDHEIARHFDVHHTSIYRWRKARNLAANTPRPPITRDVKNQAKKMLSLGASAKQVSEELGFCQTTAFRIRAHMPTDGHRRAGQSNSCLRKRALRNDKLLTQISKAIGDRLPPDAREEAVCDLYTDVIAGLVLQSNIDRAAASYRNRAMDLCGSRFGPKSLDDELADGLTLADVVEDDAALLAFETIFD